MKIRPVFLILFSVFLLLFIGCQSDSLQIAERVTVPPVRTIKVGGSGTAVLGESFLPYYLPEQFEAKIEELLQKERYFSAKIWIEKYPDLSLDLLKSTDGTKANNATLRFIAKIYDQTILDPKSAAKEGWYPLLLDRSEHPERYFTFDQQRKSMVELLQKGNLETAAQSPLELPSQAPGKMLAIDVLSLKALASLLSNPSQQTVQLLQEAIQTCEQVDLYQQVIFLIFQVETQKQLNQSWQETWKNAVQIASVAKQSATLLEDPFLWERLIRLKPTQENWPVLLQSAFSQNLAHHQTPPVLSTAFIWEKIGIWHLRRNENESALLAFQTSQSLSTNKFETDRYQLLQCKALMSLKQNSAALQTLLQLTKNSNATVSASALALLGLIELRRDNLQRGIGLLLNATEKAEQWPERTDTLADLGLAFLMVQDTKRGLQYLHQAQEQYQQSKQYSSLLQSFRNEIAYLEHIDGDSQRIRTIQKSIETLETSILN